MPVFNISSMNQIFSRAISTRRFTLLLLSLCSVIALMLAMVGIYGVTSYWAIQRTREISIRMALGCKRYGVIKMILGQIMVLVLIGLAIGSVTAFALTRFMKSLLFEISSTDQLTFVMAGALLAGVALLSTLIPAHRATKTDPLIALRSE